MVQFPNNAAGQQLASHYRERQEDAPNSLAITIINKYGSDPDNTGLGTLADPEKLKELYRAKVDSKLEGGVPHMRTGGNPFGTFGTQYGPPPPDPQTETVRYLQELNKDQVPDILAQTEVALNAPSTALEIENYNEPVDLSKLESEQPAAAPSPAQSAAIQGVANVASALIKGAMAEDPEPVSVAPRPKFGKMRQIKHKPIGPPSQFSARGGTVLGRELFLGGGEVDGPGGPKEDLVPIWASDQEYVVSANGVKRLGEGDHSQGIAALNKINFGGR